MIPSPTKKENIFTGGNTVRQYLQHYAQQQVIAKPGYFISAFDIPVTTMLLSTLTGAHFSAALVCVRC